MPKKSSAPKVEPKIAAAVGVSSISSVPGLGKKIEEAMSEAVLQAAKDGITDPVAIKDRMLAARQKVKDEFAQKVNE